MIRITIVFDYDKQIVKYDNHLLFCIDVDIQRKGDKNGHCYKIEDTNR